jgi:STE24 endopeptidase
MRTMKPRHLRRRPVLRGVLLLSAAYFLLYGPLTAQTAQPSQPVASLTRVTAKPASSKPPQPVSQPLPSYHLPPGKLAKAERLEHDGVGLHIAGVLWSILQVLLLLATGAAAWMQTAARRASTHVLAKLRLLAQGLVFTGLLLGACALLNLPLRVIGHHIGLASGLGVQGWASWFADWTKELLVEIAIATPLALLLRLALRRWPRRWWLWCWVGSIPIVLVAVLAAPVVFDPIFNHYEPLGREHPALVAELERVVARSGMRIPPDRMFLMRASDKSTTMNAYVTGIGASKRVVVWDNTINGAPPDEIALIFAHEMGHYVLHHVALGIGEGILGLLAGFWLASRFRTWAERRYGTAWKITTPTVGLPAAPPTTSTATPAGPTTTPADWSSLVVLLLAFTLLSAISEPIENTLSRRIEHAADVYGQEAVHGIVADPQATAVASFQRLGETSLDYPYPNRFVVFWMYSHPTIAARLRFAAQYNPWLPGQTPRYFPR